MIKTNRGVYPTRAGELVPIQNLQHLEPIRKNYMDIQVLSENLNKTQDEKTNI